MQCLDLVLRLSCIGLTLVEAYRAQPYGYGPPNSPPLGSHRPAWTQQASYHPGGQHPLLYTPPRIPAIPTFSSPHSYGRPPIPHHLPASYGPQALPRPVAHPESYPSQLGPLPPSAPQQHIYWYRPGKSPALIPPPRSPQLSSAVSQPALRTPFRSSRPGFLRPPPYPDSALPAVSYAQHTNTAKHSMTRVYTSPMQRDPRRVPMIRIPTGSPVISDGIYVESGDEFPREEPTTQQSDLDVAESQANESLRQPRRVFHGYEDDDYAESAQNGGCGMDLSCRTSYHCALLGGRPTFLPCSHSPRLYCCDRSVQNTINSSSNSTVKSDPQCGWNREKTSRVIGGHETDFGEIPWQAFIKVEGFRCGGALLSRSHVITAAHCVVGKKENRIEVLLGELVLKRMVEELPHERRHVSRVIIHPDYENLNVDSYDVAILVLDRPVEYQANIVPICLPDPDESFTGALATVSGWGRVYADHEIRSNHLQSVRVPIISNRLCRNWLRSRGKYAGINSDHICAGYEEGGRDSCRGDSGGPLTYQRNGRWYLVGVVSAGFSCGKPRQPGIYHRVSHSVEWISENVFSK